MVHEDHGHVVDQVLDGLATDAAQEIAEVAAVFLVFAVDIHVRAAEVAEHVAHVGKREDSKFNGIFHIENGIADIVGGFHKVDERMTNPLAGFSRRQAKRFGGDSVKVGLGREEARRASELRELRGLDHRADGRIREAHAAIQKVIFELAQDAVALRIAVEILEVRHFLVAQILERRAGAVLAEPLADGGLPRMSERRVADIVGETGRLHDGAELVLVNVLGQIFLDKVENRNGKAAAHARNLDAVREAAMHMVVHRERMHLRLAPKTTERRRENDAVVVAVVIGPVGVEIGRMAIARRR